MRLVRQPLRRALPGTLAELAPRNVLDARDPPGTTNGHKGVTALPREIMWQILDELPEKDIMAVADTCQSQRNTLAEEKLSAMLAVRAQQVHTLAQARRLLEHITTDVPTTRFRARPLAALATRIMTPQPDTLQRTARWSAIESSEVFNSVIKAILQVPPTYQDTPLMQMTEQIGALPEGDARSIALLNILAAIVQLPPEHQVEPLKAIARQLDILPEGDARAKAFISVLNAIRQLPPAYRDTPLTALSEAVGHLQETRAAAFETRIDETTRLPAEHQDARSAAFFSVLTAVVQAPPEYQAVPLAAIARQIGMLPERSARSAAFFSVLAAIVQAPPQHRAAPLTAIARQIGMLPEGGARAEAFISVLNAIRQLPPAYRDTPLTALSGAVGDLQETRAAAFETRIDETTRLPAEHQDAHSAAFFSILVAIVQAPPECQVAPLTAIARQIGKLPEGSARTEAFVSVLDAIGRLRSADPDTPRVARSDSTGHLQPTIELPAEHQDRTLAMLMPAFIALTAQIHLLPDPNRPAAFDRALAFSAHLPSARHQFAQLTALAEQVERLPGAVERWTWLVEIREAAENLSLRQPARPGTILDNVPGFHELMNKLMSDLQAIPLFA
jgi:hypothetical protein